MTPLYLAAENGRAPMANLLLAMLHKLGAEAESIGDSTEPLAI